MKCSTTSSLSLRLFVSLPSAAMSFFSGARASVSRPDVVSASPPSASIASPIGLRSRASPDTSCCTCTIRVDSLSPRALIVSSAPLRLSITWPITWSLPAIAEVSDAVWASSDSTVPPSPCRTWMIS